MKREYKSTETRLAVYFESSRDKWKERSLQKQKEKRQLLTEIRDLRRSKEKWKNDCKKAKAELEEMKNSQKKTKELLQIIMNQ